MNIYINTCQQIETNDNKNYQILTNINAGAAMDGSPGIGGNSENISISSQPKSGRKPGHRERILAYSTVGCVR